jgi:hypothetical protein
MSETQFNNIVQIMTNYEDSTMRILHDSNISEENIMSSLFSKSFKVDNYVMQYFLKYQFTNVYQNIIEKVNFFGYDMGRQVPNESKKNIFPPSFFILFSLIISLYYY